MREINIHILVPFKDPLRYWSSELVSSQVPNKTMNCQYYANSRYSQQTHDINLGHPLTQSLLFPIGKMSWEFLQPGYWSWDLYVDKEKQIMRIKQEGRKEKSFKSNCLSMCMDLDPLHMESILVFNCWVKSTREIPHNIKCECGISNHINKSGIPSLNLLKKLLFKPYGIGKFTSRFFSFEKCIKTFLTF